MQSVTESVQALLALFSADKRLYELVLHPASERDDAPHGFGSGGLLVEGFTASDTLHAVGHRDILVLSTNAHIALKRLIGCRATLHISLADGSRTRFAGLISHAALLGSEGGLARYRIRMVPWLWLLSQRRTSRVWQDQSVIDIVDAVFAQYAPHAAWQWSSDARTFLADARPRSVVAMYRETDLAFVSRLLAEEGVSWRIEDTDDTGDSAGSHQVVLFADSTNPTAFPDDATSAQSLGGTGIRFHGAHAREEQDSIQSLTATRTLQAALTTVLSADYKTARASTASVPTHHTYGGKHAPRLESYDTPGQYAWADGSDAARYARLQQEASEARNKQWRARSTVRTLRAGTRFELTQGPLQGMAGDVPPAFAVLAVHSVGINNLPKPAQESIAHLLGPVPELLAGQLRALRQGRHTGLPAQHDHSQAHDPRHDPQERQHDAERAAVLAQAQATGYANCFTAIRSDIVWRAVLTDGTGRFLHPKPTAPGSQSAIVVGLNGQTDTAEGEVCCDRLGRVRIRFHWQGRFDDTAGHAHASCWVRVAQRATGPGMGWRFLPRIGQEVIVQFIEGDIDRPVIVGALYNGQGEGGTPPTPGGNTERRTEAHLFQAAHDHAASAQANVAGGNSPVWHGASADTAGQRNAAAQWGIRSKEWGGTGYNQLLFDDSDEQGRVQWKTTQAATELNMGHLIHTADNYRGSLRGTGIELRTDAHGALRAGAGLLLSTYASQRSSAQREPVGDNAPALAHLKQAASLAASFSQAATTHKTVAYASHAGAAKANTSAIDEQAAPLEALRRAMAGMVSADSLEAAQEDAAAKETAPQTGRLPYSSAPVIGIAAKAGLGMIAGQDIQLANGETIMVASGADLQMSSGAAQRLHSGQAIGVLAGSVAAGKDGMGLQLIAAQKAITLQAQTGTMSVQAKENVTLHSVKAHIDWAAAKKITLSTAGGAAIVIEGGNITIQCPGKITVHAGKKSFAGPTSLTREAPQFASSSFHRQPVLHWDGTTDPIRNRRYRITTEDGRVFEGRTDQDGRAQLFDSDHLQRLSVELLPDDEKA